MRIVLPVPDESARGRKPLKNDESVDVLNLKNEGIRRGFIPARPVLSYITRWRVKPSTAKVAIATTTNLG
jgi:hypothetical protein